MIKLKYAILGNIIPMFLIAYYSDNIIDDVSAEKTISMWIHDEGLDAPEDGSLDKHHYYKLNK